MSTDPPDPTGRFTPAEVVGEGGMSRVHRAHDRTLQRDTAHKLLRPRHTRSPGHVARFRDEARVTGQLEHPNIVPVHDMGDADDGRPYINMKLIEGQTLEQLVTQAGEDRSSPDQIGEYVEILLKVCDALSFAHSRGVLHLDVKPANIMVGPYGQVYLMDWGGAVLQEGTSIQTVGSQEDEHRVLGTPAYISPEAATGRVTDERTDVFGLGATLFFVLTGVSPYRGPSSIQALDQAMRGERLALADRIPIPPGIDRIVDRALAHDPGDRYADVGAMRRKLAAWLRGRWSLETRTWPAGTVVIRQGDIGDEAYLIVEGQCRAIQEVDGRRVELRTMGPGDGFGEIAIITDKPRTSDVIALTELTVQVVTRDALAGALRLDSWMGKFVTAVAQRFLSAEAELYRNGDG